MSEIVKVDGAWRIAKSQKAEFVQNFLIPHLKKQVEDNNLTGKALSKARKGFGKIFIDGREKQISNVTKFLTTGKDLTLPDKGLVKESKQRRTEAIDVQTSDTQEKYDWNTQPKGMEGHHKRMVKMYAPFYEGLSKKDAKELTQWFVDEGYALGDSVDNIQLMNPKAHKEIHRWMIDNRIQVPRGPAGFSNFQLSNLLSIGPNVRGGADGQLYDGPAPKFPNLAHLPLNERLTAASIFLKYVQDPVEEKLSSLINVDSIQQSEFDRRKAELEAGYKRTDQVIAKEQEVPTAVKDFAQEAWDVGMDAVGLGAVKNTVRAGQAVINKDPVSALINVASIRHETIEPLAKRSEYKAITRDIAGK
tara:strand:+ start:295 stop:1377 length:1083 start_codon:yes stop_codon:yes gene_type:complete